MTNPNKFVETIGFGIIAAMFISVLTDVLRKYWNEIKKQGQLSDDPGQYSEKNIHAVVLQFWISFPAFVVFTIVGFLVDLPNGSFLQALVIMMAFFSCLFAMIAFIVLKEIANELRKAIAHKPAENTAEDSRPRNVQ